MQIRNRQELKFYLMADRMMNRGKFKPSIKDIFIDSIIPDYIMRFLMLMRLVSYYSSRRGMCQLLYYYRYKYNRVSLKVPMFVIY